MECHHKNILLMLEFLHSWSYTFPTIYTLTTNLILLFILMKLLSTLSVIRHLIGGKNLEFVAEEESNLRDTVD